MANLYINTADRDFLVAKLTWVQELLEDDQADDATVDRSEDITHCRKLIKRLNTMGG